MVSVHRPRAVPANALDIERLLTSHYLRADSKDGGGPIRYVDATDLELNEALERDDGFEALVRACGSAPEVARVLGDGFYGKWPDSEAPGFLRFLILCCAVVARSDANSATKDFRVNLSAAFGNEAAFNKLNALPTLWRRLAIWCAFKRNAGGLLREIVLPEDHKWAKSLIYVGLTQAITFPAWRDLKHMRSVVGHDLSLQGMDNPFEAAKRLPRLVEHDRQFSSAMREAVQEYRQLYEARASLLHLHRFWKAIRGVLGDGTRKPSRSKLEPRIELSFSLDVYDTTMSIGLVDADSGWLKDGEEAKFSDSVEQVTKALPHWFHNLGFQASTTPILRVFSEGTIPFFEEGLGIWVACHQWSLHERRCIVLHTNRGGGRLGRIAPPSRWLGDRCAVSDVLTAEQVCSVFDELARFLGTEDRSSPRGFEPRMIGGFKTGTAYLGRPTLLPRIEAPEGGGLRLLASPADEHYVEVKASSDGCHRISTSHTLCGSRLLRYEEQPLEGIESLVWQKTLTFVPWAYEHQKLGEPNSKHWVCLEEYVDEIGKEVPIAFEHEAQGDAWEIEDEESARRFEDFLEALYASGRSGWTEPELIETMREVLGPNQPSPWDVLRSLEESSWLVCWHATAWRARRWWLQSPKLFVPREQNQGIALLGGSAPEAIRRRFFATATNLGAAIEERRGVGPYSPRLCVACGVEPHLLAKELGWPLEPIPEWPLSPAPTGWPMEVLDHGSHKKAESWDWRRGRFGTNPAFTTGAVRLERFTRARRDRSDLFVVTSDHPSSVRVCSSRVVAIVEAYRRARTPLFSLEGNRLMRLPRDGYLPLPLMLVACLRLGRASGPVRLGDKWGYAYPADGLIADAVCRTLGATIVSGRLLAAVRELSPSELVGRRRHRA